MTNQKTGLFSATVSAFIIEFYKKLSPDQSGQTVDLLCQISQQLPNSRNATCSSPKTDQSFSPGAPIIWVNAMWIISLLLSLSSALFATLLQQWSRRYVQMPQIPSKPNERARVRSFLFFGTRKFNMRAAIETAPTLLHLSVFLFFVGLVVLFYTIHKTVAIIVSISVGIFIVAYIALTILPYIYHDCPYRTPMSNIWWYISHPSLYSVFICLRWLLIKFHDWMVPHGLGEVALHRQRILVSLLTSFQQAVEKHLQRFKDGFRETIVKDALEAPDIVDADALTWWLQRPALAEESKAQDFLACIPKKAVVQLMHNPDESGRFVFREQLVALLRSCGPGSLAVGLKENERKTRLQVCLTTIHRIALAAVDPDSNIDIEYVRSHFADITRMQSMWADWDPGIRVVSRSICALLTRCLLRRGLLDASDLGWLQDVTGEPSNTIFNSSIAVRDHMNLRAFVYGVLSGQQGDLAAKHATSFTETLAILMDLGNQRPFDGPKFQGELHKLIQEVEQETTGSSAEVAGKLRRMFRDLLT
jgi:hypothetical protein